jgi:glycine/D-amino acid oxidase-like deaminating enzyme
MINNLSYWEAKSWFSGIDFCVVGSGIVGLNCALHLKLKHPKAKVLIIEKGILPQGASTKNAGFACFGSLSEILSDLENHSKEQVFNLVKKRVDGLNLLLKTLGKEKIDYKQYGGFELFFEADKPLFEECAIQIDDINHLLKGIYNADIFSIQQSEFNYNGMLSKVILNPFEAQIDTGLMMSNLLKKVMGLGVLIINATELERFSEDNGKVTLFINGIETTTQHLFIATNAFSSQLLEVDVTPARNQVIITKPIKDLNIKGTFHLDRGYYYFRNIDDRILLGGGRHIDAEIETTSEFGITYRIQQQLEQILKQNILPHQNVEVDMRWSGILGVGSKKEPIVKSVSDRVHCAVRLGGMGVAIGSSLGKELSDLI